jgi:hypothetical protein
MKLFNLLLIVSLAGSLKSAPWDYYKNQCRTGCPPQGSMESDEFNKKLSNYVDCLLNYAVAALYKADNNEDIIFSTELDRKAYINELFRNPNSTARLQNKIFTYNERYIDKNDNTNTCLRLNVDELKKLWKKRKD